jgi:hypothetical protein
MTVPLCARKSISATLSSGLSQASFRDDVATSLLAERRAQHARAASRGTADDQALFRGGGAGPWRTMPSSRSTDSIRSAGTRGPSAGG